MEVNPNKNNGFSQERRQYERKLMEFNLTYSSDSRCGVGLSKDVSEGGMCAILDRDLPVGTALEMEFAFPSGDSVPIEAFSKIIWTKKTEEGFLTGVKFGI